MNIDNSYQTELKAAIKSANSLLKSIKEGNANGNYSVGTKQDLQNSINEAKKMLSKRVFSSTPNDFESTIYKLNSSCMDAETKVIHSENLLNDKKATLPTITLYKNLQTVAKAGFLFGMHDPTSYGIGWVDDGKSNRSDVKDLCGSHPSVFSWDMFNIVEYDESNAIRRRINVAYEQGGIITMCWHQNNPLGGDSWVNEPAVVKSILPGGENHEKYIEKLDKIAAFAKSLRGPSGESIPILFRPYHEQSGDWFWWGKNRCTPDDYKNLWQFTQEYLRDTKNVHNFIYVQSPDGHQFSNSSSYMDLYPGDKYVDVLGLDYYFGTGDQPEIDKLVDRMRYLTDYAAKTNKVATLAETGDREGWHEPDNLSIKNWYTRCFYDAMTSKGVNMAYGAVWRNGSENHHFVPFPGHPAVEDFLKFVDKPKSLLLRDIPNFYNKELTLEHFVKKAPKTKEMHHSYDLRSKLSGITIDRDLKILSSKKACVSKNELQVNR